MTGDRPRPASGGREGLDEGLGPAFQRDPDLVEAYVLRGRDLDDARDGVERGVGLLRTVAVDKDLDARVGVLGELHHVARQGAAGGLDGAGGRHLARGARAGIGKMRDEGRKAVGRRQVEVDMVTPATV